MTKEKFKEIYPNGLKTVIVSFQKALRKIMTTDEIDKIINHTKGKEKCFLKAFKATYRTFPNLETLPIWFLLTAIESIELLKNVIAEMVIDCKEIYNGDDEE